MYLDVTFKVPIKELTPETLVQTIDALGVQRLGGYAVKTGSYGNGAKYSGNLLKLGPYYFTLVWDTETSQITMKPIILDRDKYFMCKEMAVEVYGMRDGSNIWFQSDEDAVEFLKTTNDRERRDIMVKAPGFDGNAMLYLTLHR